MRRNTYRWRTNPDQIARFVHDKELPRNTPVLLRPNEVCVVLENGRIAGIVTQQVMRANPTTSMLRRMFGGKRQRSYLFGCSMASHGHENQSHEEIRVVGNIQDDDTIINASRGQATSYVFMDNHGGETR